MDAQALSGLSREEAALIEDVLSRLSIGNGAGAGAATGLQVATMASAMRDPHLAELELAEQAIEQELRGLDGPSSYVASLQPAMTGHAGRPQPSAGSPQPSLKGVGAHRSTLAYSFPGHISPVREGYGVAASHAASAADFLQLPSGSYGLAQPGAVPPPPEYPSSVYASPLPLAKGQPPLFGSAAQPLREVAPAPAQPPPRLPLATATPATTADGGSVPALTSTPSQTMSLLQEMREKLRRQQQELQLQQEQLTSAGTSGGAGAAAVTAEGPEEAAGEQGSMPSPKGSPRGTSSRQGEANGGSAARTGSPPRGGPATSSVTAVPSVSASGSQLPRRVPLPGSVEAAKAFTMLNARTNLERYGPGLEKRRADAPSSVGPARAPVKLPEQERSSRLQQLYERTHQWRKRCEERHAKARHDQETSALEQCTFSPQVCTASNLMMQGKPATAAYQELSKYATPTKHQQAVGAHDRPQSAATSSAHGTPARGVAPGRGRGVSANSTPSGAGIRNSSGGGSGAHGAYSARDSSASPTPTKLVVNGPQVGARMYGRAIEQRVRHEERALQQVLEEERQRHFTARVQGVTPRVYNPPEPPSSRYLPSGMEECTFHPRTRYRMLSSRVFEEGDPALRQRFDDPNHQQHRQQHKQQHYPPRTPGRRNQHHDAPPSTAASASLRSTSFAGFPASRPKSAPHMRPGADGKVRRMESPPRNHPSSSAAGRSQAFSTAGTHGAASVHTTVSISHELDWEEFLARQGRFLSDREHKLAILEQGEPIMPHMSPGSKRLLRERQLRESTAARADAAESAEASVAAQPSTHTAGSSPGRLDRKLRTIMEMYRECTFQPQITRRAAAMPHRSVDELADGGRTRREDWLEQQRVQQQEREVEGATFRPERALTKDAFPHVRPRISLRNPDAYLAHIDLKRQQREALRVELESEREALELQHCTFKPQTTPLPAYLIRRLQEQQLQQLQELHAMQEMQDAAMMAMQEQAEWGQGGYEEYGQGYEEDGGVGVGGAEGEEEYYADTVAVEAEAAAGAGMGVGAAGGEQDYAAAGSAADFDPYLYGQLHAAGEADFTAMMPDEALDLGVPDMDPAFKDAYQRALAYAMTQPQGS